MHALWFTIHKSKVDAGFDEDDDDDVWEKSGIEKSFSITYTRPCSACMCQNREVDIKL